MERDEWTTPSELFRWLNINVGFNFDVDLCATKDNSLCVEYYTKEDNALIQDLSKHKSIWCNPPYSKSKEFADKFYILNATNIGRRHTDFCLLLPVRSDRIWFQRILDHRQIDHMWFTGRLHFGDSGKGAFMYNILFYSRGTWNLPKYISASQFNANGRGRARN